MKNLEEMEDDEGERKENIEAYGSVRKRRS
jgi:hypothetical protein